MSSTKKNYWTNNNIHQLPPRADGKDPLADHIVWHPEIDRFGVRMSAGKPMSYVIMYFLGRDRKRTIGKVSQISLEAAITQAKNDFEMIRDNVDPAIERQVKRDAHNDRLIDFVIPASSTTQGGASGLSETHVRTQTAPPAGRPWRKHTGKFQPAYFARLHDIPVKMITRRMVADELDRLTEVARRHRHG